MNKIKEATFRLQNDFIHSFTKRTAGGRGDRNHITRHLQKDTVWRLKNDECDPRRDAIATRLTLERGPDFGGGVGRQHLESASLG
jgi:hypothetical protein